MVGLEPGRRAAASGWPAFWWFAAMVLVPAALAGVALLWPGPQLADDLRDRAASTLSAAGLGSVAVTIAGRDARLDAVPRGSELAAAAAVAGVTGIRDVQIGTATAPPLPGAHGTAPTAAVPAVPDAPGKLSAMARQVLTGRIAAAVAAAPITFDPDSAELTVPAAATVMQIALLLVGEPDATVAVDGYVADTPGPAETAQRLSESRAAAVTAALVEAGVERSRITATGRGDTRPLSTPAASRRVEISIP